METFSVGAVTKLGAVLPLVAAIAMSLGVAHAAGVEGSSGSSTTRSAVATSKPAQAGSPVQVAAGQAVSARSGPKAEAKKPQTLETVVVTGTLIPQPALTGTAALTVIGSEQIRLQGVANVDQLLKNVPSAQGVSSSNTDSENSFSTIGLRRMGANRTLVLIDGNRVVPGDPTAFNTGDTDVNGTNLNFIPTALVQRVEVLTGGASAIYGSDAVAGVVNFIMKKDINGIQFDGQWSTTKYGGTTYTPTIIWGATSADGKGSVELYASYLNRDAVPLSKRYFSSCAWLPNGQGGRRCFGSSDIPEGNFTSLDRPLGDNTAMINPDGTRTFVPEDGRVFNFDNYSNLVRAEQRYNFGGFAHRKINEHLEVYGSAMFMHDKNQDPSAPSVINFSPNQINCSNPFLSNQQRGFLCPNPGQTQANTLIGRRLLEMGPRMTLAKNTEYRVQLGLKGVITDGWNYNVSAQRSENSVSQDYLNFDSANRVQQALQVTTDSSGNPICIDPSGGCVPLDLFRYLGITPDMANFIRTEGLEHGTTKETVASASVNGDLGQYGVRSPFAQHGVQIAIGGEYRRNSLDFLPDPGLQSGETEGEGGGILPVSGSFNDRDVFTELKVPAIQNEPFIKNLSFDIAYRLSKYRIATRASGIETHTYKLGVRYAPNDDIALRASWNRSVRVPDIQELFFPTSVKVLQGADPCAGASPGASLADCERTGVTAAQYGNIQQCPSQQCNVQVGGNLYLKPENAITRQIGLVLTPRFLTGLTGTVDYYDIVLTNAIGSLSSTSVLGSCLQSGVFCDQIHRATGGALFGNGSGAFINGTDVNTGFLRSRGIDVSIDYRRSLADMGLGDNGDINFSLVGTYVSDLQKKNTPTSPEFDCAGLYGHVCGVPTPRWRHLARLTWENPMGAIPGFAVSLAWRFIGGTSLDANRTYNSQLNPTGAPVDTVDAKISSRSYFDFATTYQLPIESQDITLRFGINNLTAREPPIITLNALPLTTVFATPNNTFASLYDTLGRVYFLGIHANFN